MKNEKEKKKIKVRLRVGIYNFDTLAENEIEEQSLRKSAKFIDEAIVDFQKDSDGDYEKALVMSCLALAKENFQKEISNEEHLDSVGNVIAEMQEKIKIHL